MRELNSIRGGVMFVRAKDSSIGPGSHGWTAIINGIEKIGSYKFVYKCISLGF